MMMKTISTLLLMLALAGLTSSGIAEDKKKEAKAYPLKTCIVSDEALGGDHGDPYVFTHDGQEFKLCCKPCLKDFNKDPKGYHKKLSDAQKKQEKPDKKK
jgi:hypothetical protein